MYGQYKKQTQDRKTACDFSVLPNVKSYFHSRSPSSHFFASEKRRTPLWGVLRFWWTIKGSNLGPTGYEPVALTN